MKTILVTGANGFIGKYIKKFNNFENYNLLYGTTSNLANSDGYIIFDNLYSNIDIVLKNTDIDIIIHCASIIPHSFEMSDKKLFFNNTIMMTNLSEFAFQKKLKKFIYLSSFGSMENLEKYDIKDYYTLSKITGEHICSIMESKGIEAASLRISSPFGEFYNKNNVLSLFIDLALQNKTLNVYGSGNRKQNFIYVGNILEYIECCLENKISGVHDVVNKNNISMNQLAQTIVKLCNSMSKIEIGNKKDPLENVNLPKYSLIKSKEIDYEEKYTFENALMKYIEYRKGILKI
ncbi:NAD-dependent epimerase/dehydratase family protein [Aliarcobacter butzleri]|uniref:NAD-dependent epimerase/dehydratase family protein n=1 Tax=Aliarcobacter butzleri TaxID=28197 RepID=UPI00263E508D|nr:NAD(P)-dependent oxidoreductase [Aliarcobacter butzleri]MDN5096030.1 NAD(P)-dependent oxidoreductase [Aliarcobacter butzleri]